MAEVCNQGTDGQGIVWHGFAVFRHYETRDGEFMVDELVAPDKSEKVDQEYTQKIVPKEIVILSFSDKKYSFFLI